MNDMILLLSVCGDVWASILQEKDGKHKKLSEAMREMPYQIKYGDEQDKIDVN